MEEILKADNEWHQSTVKAGRSWASCSGPTSARPSPGRSIDRMLGAGRKPLIQSFGTEPQVVVEHCLAANNIRRDRDNWLTAVMVLCGLLFLPGCWSGCWSSRSARTIAKREDKRAGALGTDAAGRAWARSPCSS